MASDILERCKKPDGTSDLKECECIGIMKGAYFQSPKQTKTSCDGYRNPYTKQPSHVCNSCKWFSDNIKE